MSESYLGTVLFTSSTMSLLPVLPHHDLIHRKYLSAFEPEHCARALCALEPLFMLFPLLEPTSTILSLDS